MARYEQIRDRMPSLYRPQPGDEGLMARFLQAVGRSLEQVDLEAAAVLQAHWFEYADRAFYDAFFRRRRQLQEPPLPPPLLGDPSLLSFPYIDDLAYLSALVGLSPWQEPTRETVEAFRLRVRRTVALYRDGVGTIQALRRMVELQLPLDLSAAPALRDRPFWIEEGVAAAPTLAPALPNGPPTDIVGPLMRWRFTLTGLRPVLPTLYIQGVTPEENKIAATESPLIERYGGPGQPLGIAYQGNLAPGETLRIQPAYNGWLGTATRLQRASSTTDPTAAGPWTPEPEGPEGTVVAIAQTEDSALWVAVNSEGSGQLWRYDGQTWSGEFAELSAIHDLYAHGPDLLIGSDDGLVRLPLFPPQGEEQTLTTLPSAAVYALAAIADQIWLGTASGAFILNTDGTLAATELQGVEVYAIYSDGAGARFFGTSWGLLQQQPELGVWYRYRGQVRTEQQSEWDAFDPATGPADAEVNFLPPVRAIARSRDGTLWLGTDQGLARYLAQPVRGLTSETVLHAFPDISTGPVHQLSLDPRGLLWIGCDRGLLRYDGYRLWQYQGDRWQVLGQADRLYPADRDPIPRDGWRYNPAASAWERFTPLTVELALRTIEAEAVHSVAWSDGAIADLGQWDGTSFTPDPGAADPTPQLRMRYKPRPTEIRDGGLVAVPRLPVGGSTWRYLQVEGDNPITTDSRPLWTSEGRRIGNDPSHIDPESGRFDFAGSPPSHFDASLFAFLPAARVWLSWQPHQPASVLVRLQRLQAGEAIDPIILDRVWAGMQQVRPAGVQVQLALGDDLLRGDLSSG
ncbi:hypothetical protein ACQ4N7_26020 [Nodosilinea sp. AN01ver1]|uniref:hypothetical protein n=1 Tax=Nodosilinea sp. AN01ver1 TaxID=3423362 RepID=UPI003D320DB1